MRRSRRQTNPHIARRLAREVQRAHEQEQEITEWIARASFRTTKRPPYCTCKEPTLVSHEEPLQGLFHTTQLVIRHCTVCDRTHTIFHDTFPSPSPFPSPSVQEERS